MFKRVSLALACLALMASAAMAANPTYVVQISVDGLGYNYLENLMLPTQTTYNVNNFKRLVNEGAYTFNARNEYSNTETLPNHVTQITARPITGTPGHNWSSNNDPTTGQTLYTQKGSYVASVFDVVHDNGMKTQLVAGKTKFSLFTTSYNSTNGRVDPILPDNGRNKIDYSVTPSSGYTYAATVANTFVTRATAVPTQYSFLHFTDPDYAGHYQGGWGNAGYNSSLQACNAALGTVFSFITSNTTYKDHTYIILTADHGGTPADGHGTASDLRNYQIPFFVWGPDVPAHTDLYGLNSGIRFNPYNARYDYTYANQPIRNGEAVNLALDLLGLPAVTGSFYNYAQNLVVTVPEPASLAVLSLGGVLLLARRKHRHA